MEPIASKITSVTKANATAKSRLTDATQAEREDRQSGKKKKKRQQREDKRVGGNIDERC